MRCPLSPSSWGRYRTPGGVPCGAILCSACLCICSCVFFFFSSRRRHTRSDRDWSSDVCSSDLARKTMRLNATAWTHSLVNQTTRPDDSGFRIGVPYHQLYALSNDAGDKSALLEIGRASCRERV